ncbi:MAG: metal ABC transporter permease, partial [Pseudomonadales bacterium]|nr:metal ABC transporter permease [Pseudomonadales bacterium]
QVIGVYLVFASLIIPAIAVRAIDQPLASLLALLVGMGGYSAGLYLSALFDLPSGACIVWTLALSALVFAPFTRRFQASRALC